MRILFLDAFHGGSHAAVAQGYARHSRNEVVIESLPIDGGWRWRMRGAAITLARRLRERGGGFDLIVATDMLDLATFLGLTRDITVGVPVAVYFHENQLTYPLPEGRTRDLAFPWINYTSMLAADAVIFNSAFHRQALLDALPGLVGRFHDYQERDLIAAITAKAHVLHPGIDLARLDAGRGTVDGKADARLPTVPHPTSHIPHPTSHIPRPTSLLWNSRWEYDKNPAAFFGALEALEARGVDFRVIVAGEHIDPNHADFLAAHARFASRTLAWGYAPDTASYTRLLHQADIVVSTAVQEFFGISLVEAMACGCVPIAPRRLAYPEVIPATIHQHCLYDSADDLVDKLVAAVSLPPEVREAAQAAAAQYDWPLMAPRYDTLFESLVRGRSV